MCLSLGRFEITILNLGGNMFDKKEYNKQYRIKNQGKNKGIQKTIPG